MQLRRGPPEAPLRPIQKPALRLVTAPPGAVGAPRGWRRWRSFDSYFLRIVAGALLVTIPASIVLGFVMSTWSTQTSIDQANVRVQATAESVEFRITDWIAERKAELRSIAQGNVGQIGKLGLDTRLLASIDSHPSFDDIQIPDLGGKVVASTVPGEVLATPEGMTFAQSLSIETLGSMAKRGAGGLQWIMTAPIVGTDGKPQGVVAA